MGRKHNFFLSSSLCLVIREKYVLSRSSSENNKITWKTFLSVWIAGRVRRLHVHCIFLIGSGFYCSMFSHTFVILLKRVEFGWELHKNGTEYIVGILIYSRLVWKDNKTMTAGKHASEYICSGRSRLDTKVIWANNEFM